MALSRDGAAVRRNTLRRRSWCHHPPSLTPPRLPHPTASRLQRSLAALRAEAAALCRSNAELNAQAWLVALLLRHCDALVEVGSAISLSHRVPGAVGAAFNVAASGAAATNSSSGTSSSTVGDAGKCNGNKGGSTGSRGGLGVSATPLRLLGRLLRHEQAAADQAAAVARQSAAVAGSGFANGVTGAGSNAEGWALERDSPPLLPLGWRPMAAAARWLSGSVEVSTAALKRSIAEFGQCAALVGP
jgi:hypothetical protein